MTGELRVPSIRSGPDNNNITVFANLYLYEGKVILSGMSGTGEITLSSKDSGQTLKIEKQFNDPLTLDVPGSVSLQDGIKLPIEPDMIATYIKLPITDVDKNFNCTRVTIGKVDNGVAIIAQEDPDGNGPVGALLPLAVGNPVHNKEAATKEYADTKAPKESPVFTGSISLGRKSGTTVGVYSSAIGQSVTASGPVAHAEGSFTTATGNFAHAEGYNTTSSMEASHAEGKETIASGLVSHAEGMESKSTGDYSHAEGYKTEAVGRSSHAEGQYTYASGESSHAEGLNTGAFGAYSHSEGENTTAKNYASHAGGHYNKEMTAGGSGSNTTGDAMVLGNGVPNASGSNCFRVTYAGDVYGLSTFKTSGADYAEYFEWADGNPDAEDRVGLFVSMDGTKIKIANPGDYILGIVSGQAAVIGNADEDWLGRWEHDEFGRFVMEYLEESDEEIEKPEDEEELAALLSDPEIQERDDKLYRHIATVVDHVTPSYRFKANPDYDSSQEYTERKDRPEWSAIGMMGVLAVWDDGTCEVNGFCRVAEGGTATAAEKYVPGETYRVIERTAEHVVKVVFR